ncbi:MAG: protein kinase domain-containing protein [Bradymonadia bacterium]
MQPALLSGRYRLGPKLGAGTGGVVYQGHDRLLDRAVAIKILPSTASNRDEFLVARSLDHPFVVATHDFGQVDAEHDFVVMDLVKGQPLDAWGQSQDITAKLKVALCGALALAHLHTRRLTHADIKPDNLLVEDTEQGPVARLIDFGMATDAQHGFKGTPAYAAPEIFQGGAPTSSSDVYAFGVSLYEMLSGINPFAAETIEETSERQRTLTPPLLEQIPAQLAQVIAKCMAKPIESRYADAEALLFALTDALPELTATVDASTLIRPEGLPLQEREDLVEKLGQTLDNISEGPFRISAPKGGGLSRVLDTIYSQARLLGRRVFWLSGRQAEHHLHHQLEQWLSDAPIEPAAIPSLSSEQLDALLARLSSEPTVILIDDLDAASTPELTFLSTLCGRMTPKQPLWLYYTTRPAGCRKQAQLNLPGHTHRLTALTPAGVHGALQSALGTIDPEQRFARLCHTATEGTPGALWALIRHQIQSGRIWWGEGRWRLDDRLLLMAPEALCPPDSADDAPPLDLTQLTAHGREALLSVAVLSSGPAKGTSLKRQVVDAMLSANHRKALKNLLKGGLLTTRGTTLKLTHGGHLEPLLAQLKTLKHRRLHRLAAIAYSEADPNSLTRWAYHTREAGYPEQAIPLMARAASEALRTGHPEQAAQHHRWLILNGADAVEHHERAGDCELLNGDHSRALDHYREALALGADAGRLSFKLAWALIDAGQYDESLVHGEQARVHGETSGEQETLFTAHIGLGWAKMMKGSYDEALAHAEQAEACLPTLLERTGWSQLSRYHRLQGTIAWHQGRSEDSIAFFKSGIELGLERGELEALAECYLGLGTGLMLQGNYEEAIEAQQEAILRNEALGRLRYSAKSLNSLGINQYLKGRLKDAEKSWARFRDMCTRTHDLPDLVIAHNNLGFLHKDRGALERAAAELERGRAIAEETGFQRGLAMVLGNLGEVRGAQGHLEQGRQCLEEARELALGLNIQDEALEATRRLVAIRLKAGQPQEAFDEAEMALKDAKEAKADGEIAHLLQLKGEAQLALGHPWKSTELLMQAISRFTPGSLDGARAALALSESALACQDGLVLTLLQKARQTATEVGASDQLIRTIDEHIRTHRQARANDQQGHQMLEIARSLSEKTSLEEMLPALAERAMKLVGAQQGMVILYEEDGVVIYPDPVTYAAHGQQVNYSRSIADRVHTSGQALLSNQMLDQQQGGDASNNSIIANNIRAVVCVPLVARGATIGVLYVDSQEPNLACDEYKDLLEMLARQTAVNVRNVWLLEEARRSEEAVNNFLANINHELRTPLNGILSALTLALDTTDLPTEVRSALQTGLDCTENLTVQIHNVLDLARFRGDDARPLKPIPFDLHTLLPSVLRVVRADAEAKGITVDAFVDPTVPREVVADKDRLRQVLMYLLSNALKFTPSGGSVKVHLTVNALLDGKAMVRFAVRDTGVGITPEAMPNLFKPFSQADASSTREHGGTGLGLYLAKRQVEQMSGEIEVTSVPGEGSTFYFTSLVEADVKAPAPETFDPVEELSCLVVEDNPVNRKVASRILSKMGHTVDTADNGQLGVEAFKSKHYDVILMDLQMPVMDGFAATRAIRALRGAGSQIPIIAVTANVTPHDREQSKLSGMDDFVCKPIKKSLLAEVIARCVARKATASL